MMGRVRLERRPPEATAWVNGEQVTIDGEGSLLVEPGAAHELVVTAPGRQDFEATLELAFGADESLAVQMDLDHSLLSWVLLGAGAAVGAAGAGLMVNAASVASNYQDTRRVDSAGTVVNMDGAQARSMQAEANTFQGVGLTLIGVGLTSAITGVLWRWVLEDTTPPEWR